MMKKVLSAILSFPGLAIIGTIIFSVLIAVFGPLLGIGDARPLDSIMARIIAISVLWLITLMTIMIVLLLHQKKDSALAEEIVDSDDNISLSDEVVQGELSEMRDKMRDALKKLRKSKFGRRHLYELPWYLVIGPPGAGKTTAIVNSGLNFPLADTMGKDAAIGGVGGTRNCDWWFTNEAVLIDTAGRYTTQESDAEADQSAWRGFLALLKRHRRRQPVNGAIVAISLSDLSIQDRVTRSAHAAAVRRRLQELRGTLGVRFPVYVLITKADLIVGFTEYFDTLDRQQREQVWGFTFDLKAARDERQLANRFREEFDLLLNRLNAQTLDRMQSETDPQRRSLIAGFPNQVASLRQVAQEFVTEVFQENNFTERQMLRGIYFTSGTQEGAPIDRLMMGMARTFGIGRQSIGTGSGTGRSFFLTSLLRDVIVGEAGLVSADDKVERRYRWVTRGAIAATVLAAVGLSVLWTRSYLGNQDLLAKTEAQIATYKAQAAQIPGSPVGDTDLPAIVPALNLLRDMPGNIVIDPDAADPALRYGLYQGEVIGSEAAQAYRAALNTHLLPRLLLRLEEQVENSRSNPALLYEATKAYLILGLRGPMDKETLTEWLSIDWQLSYPGDDRSTLRDDLASHLDALLSQPMTKVELNGPLLKEVEEQLGEMPMAERIYNGIIDSAAAADLTKFRITTAGGPGVGRVFVRSSGKPLSEGIDGIYTYEGFNTFFLGEALQVAKRLQSESWVLGKRATTLEDDAALARMSQEVLDLYYVDYAKAYETLLDDLDIIPIESLPMAIEVTNVISGPSSPVKTLLEAVAREVRLTDDRSAPENTEAQDALGEVGGQELRRMTSSRNRMLLEALIESNRAQGGATASAPGAYIEDRFRWLIELTAAEEGAPSQLDAVVQAFDEVRREMVRMGSSGGLTAADGSAAQVLLRQEAARHGGPLGRWASQIGTSSSGISARGTRAELNARWQSQVLNVCTQALNDRYPFTPRSSSDVTIQDFSRLFAPGGLIDKFVEDNLLSYIDIGASPWAWKSVNGAELGISDSVLEQLQLAAEIRDAFFSAGPTPMIRFEIRPEALSENAREVSLEIHGKQINYRHNTTPEQVAVTWPGEVGLSRITFSPPLENMENSFVREGPWAWFRVFNSVPTPAAGAGDQNRVIFKVGSRTGIFKMRLGSTINPFTLPAMSRFRCPQSL